ncbi:uncharacterized protein LOC133194690 [Saccostrea echinata]|uniref:uncharacterized protein LOC133194690 n=1 Tax=Saccostrea echinata TaxID=191078 RepID=UPI002A838122|nr:uncharacterized protein LOC133194690 [Saccostrea echinata]
MVMKKSTVFFVQVLGLSTVFGGCSYNVLTGRYCYYLDYYDDLYPNTLGTGAIVGIVLGALAGLATLIGLIVCLYVTLCRKPTQIQGAVMHIPTTTAGTTLVQNAQPFMQPYHQQGLHQANPVQMQATGQGVAASFASPPQYSPPQQSAENQDPPPK